MVSNDAPARSGRTVVPALPAPRQRAMVLSLELRSAMSLSRLWANQGDLRPLQTCLRPAIGDLAEGSQTTDLKLAGQLQAEFGHPVLLSIWRAVRF